MQATSLCIVRVDRHTSHKGAQAHVTAPSRETEIPAAEPCGVASGEAEPLALLAGQLLRENPGTAVHLPPPKLPASCTAQKTKSLGLPREGLHCYGTLESVQEPEPSFPAPGHPHPAPFSATQPPQEPQPICVTCSYPPSPLPPSGTRDPPCTFPLHFSS